MMYLRGFGRTEYEASTRCCGSHRGEWPNSYQLLGHSILALRVWRYAVMAAKLDAKHKAQIRKSEREYQEYSKSLRIMQCSLVLQALDLLIKLVHHVSIFINFH